MTDASPPRNVRATLIEKYILVTWEEPEQPNGILEEYRVSFCAIY